MRCQGCRITGDIFPLLSIFQHNYIHNRKKKGYEINLIVFCNLAATHQSSLSLPPRTVSHLWCFNPGTISRVSSNLSKSYSSFTVEGDGREADRLEKDSRILADKSTTCRCWGQISSPIPSQATRFNRLKAPASGAQATPIPSESALPLKKGHPSHTQIPGSRCGDSPGTHTHPGPSLLLRILSPRQSPAPSLPPPSTRVPARPAGWGKGVHVPAPPPPRQCPGERSARPAVPSRSRQHSPFFRISG